MILVHFIINYKLEGQGHILFSMVGYFGVHVKTNSLRPIVCEI